MNQASGTPGLGRAAPCLGLLGSCKLPRQARLLSGCSGGCRCYVCVKHFLAISKGLSLLGVTPPPPDIRLGQGSMCAGDLSHF